MAEDRAAPEAAEPVAWQERTELSPGKFSDWYERKSLARDSEITSDGIRYQFRPLYAAPPTAQAGRDALDARIRRLQDAIEAECDGLAIGPEHARAILEWLDSPPSTAAAIAKDPK